MDKENLDFEAMVKAYKSTVYAVCYMFAEGEQAVCDLFQECLINLWKGYGSFQGRSDLRTWVYRVSLNTCISLGRKKKREQQTLPLNVNLRLFERDGEVDNQYEMLHQRISRLGPFDRAIVLLWLENMSYEEIGAIVGITAKNVSVRLFRIKEQLKNMSND